jgi:flavin reductase (DIM6/NTAB) family NADH-FMN oxidoreductase RutF
MSFTCFDRKNLAPRDWYTLMIGSIVPRPIAFVSTVNLKGQVNAAPFSFFNGVSSDPPVLSISVTPKRDGTLKDTLINIRETGEFVVNIVPENLMKRVHETAKTFPYGVNELSEVGLTTLESLYVRAPRVAECPIHIECRLYKEVQVGEGLGSSILVLGQILAFHVRSDLLKDPLGIDFKKLKPLARLGGSDYGIQIQDTELPRT